MNVKSKFKKSQIFIFDLIFSIIILVISFTIVFSYYSHSSNNISIFSLNLDIISSLTETKISSLNDDLFLDLFKSGEIKDYNNLISNQILYEALKGNTNLAQNITKLFLENYNIKNYNINITLYNNSNKYLLYNSTNNNLTYFDSLVSSDIKRNIIYFEYNDSVYKDYILEVKIWQ